MCPTGWERDNIVIPAPLIQSKGPGPPPRHWEQDVPPPRKQEEVLKCPYQQTRRHSIYGSSLGSSNWLKTKLITFPLPKPGFFSCFHYFSQNQHHPHSCAIQKTRRHLGPFSSCSIPNLLSNLVMSCASFKSIPCFPPFPPVPKQTIIIPNQDNHTYSYLFIPTLSGLPHVHPVS